MPESITSLGTIFKDNENLTKLTCNSSDILSLFYNHSGTIIESENHYVVTFSYYKYNYYIPNTLKEIHLLGNFIDSYSFYKMKSVQKIHIPSTVSAFGAGAFTGCSGLTNVYFETDRDWRYNPRGVPEWAPVSKAIMNNSELLASQLKAHGEYDYYWSKL